MPKTNLKMKTWVHFVVSSILAVIFYPIFNWKVLFIFAGGVLIDVDHYLWYVYRYNNFNLFGCYSHYIRQFKDNFKKNIGILLLFHTIEFLVIAVIFSFLNELVLIFTIGLVSHYLLDLIFLYSVPKRFIANHSIIHWLIKNEIQKFK